MAVTGLVTGLTRADTQEPWIHGLGGEVSGIFLPTARLRRAGSWAVTDRSEANRGRLSFMAQAGAGRISPRRGLQLLRTLLGRGEAAGSEAIGTWQAVAGSTTLAGGFGAMRGLDLDPPGAAVTGDYATIGRTGDVRATLETGPAALGRRGGRRGHDGGRRVACGGARLDRDQHGQHEVQVRPAEDGRVGFDRVCRRRLRAATGSRAGGRRVRVHTGAIGWRVPMPRSPRSWPSCGGRSHSTAPKPAPAIARSPTSSASGCSTRSKQRSGRCSGPVARPLLPLPRTIRARIATRPWRSPRSTRAC